MGISLHWLQAYTQLHETLLAALNNARTKVLNDAGKAIGDLSSKSALSSMKAVTDKAVAEQKFAAIEDVKPTEGKGEEGKSAAEAKGNGLAPSAPPF